jgi:hypothetical protein
VVDLRTQLGLRVLGCQHSRNRCVHGLHDLLWGVWASV